MRYEVLGPLRVLDADGERLVGSPTQRVVLALLIARRGAVVPADVLIEAVWGESPPRSAVGSLRTYVSRLRRVVGDAIVAERDGYRLDASSATVDALEFERDASSVLDRGAREARERLDAADRALGGWRGRAYGELADHPALVAEAHRLDELRVDVVERRAELLLELGDHPRAAAEARAVVADHPFRERSWSTLVRALVAAERSADALRVAHRAREVLADAGLEPSAGLLAAEADALGIGRAPAAVEPIHDRPDHQPREGPRLRGGGARLPTPASSFVGRERDVAALVERLGRSPIVTLVGPGGVGKTRLALEAARRACEHHGWESRMVELGNVADADDVVDVVVAALGIVVDGPTPEESLARAGELPIVLVLDNAEHVVDAVASVVEDLALGRGTMRVLATSRERLGVDGEHVWRVPPLSADGDGAARRLFVERAAASGAVVDGSAALVDTIIDRLDGLPLAIEMAAAQLAVCTLEELAALLQRSTRTLTSPRRTVATRHRTLADVIDWSLELLEVADADVLRRVAVFAGPFTTDDASGVLGIDVAATIRRLAERSLLTVSVADGTTRFSMLRTVRDHLSEAGADADREGASDEPLRRAHAGWFLERVLAEAARLPSVDEPAARRAITWMLDDLRAAHRWSARHDRAVALAISAALHRYVQNALNDEVMSWAERLVTDLPPGTASRGADDPAELAVVLASAATRRVTQGDHDGGADLARRALAIAPDDRSAIPGREALADVCLYDGRLDESAEGYRALVRAARTVGDRWYEAAGRAGEALASLYAGGHPDLPEDEPDLAPTTRAFLAYVCGEIIADTDPPRALAHFDRTLQFARLVPSPMVEGVALVAAAALRGRTGEPDRALAAYRTAIEHWLALADRTHQVTTLRNLVLLLHRLQLAEETAELLSAIDGSGVPTYGIEAARLEAAREWAAATLEGAELAARRRAGARRDVTATARWALRLIDRLLGGDPASVTR